MDLASVAAIHHDSASHRRTMGQLAQQRPHALVKRSAVVIPRLYSLEHVLTSGRIAVPS